MSRLLDCTEKTEEAEEGPDPRQMMAVTPAKLPTHNPLQTADIEEAMHRNQFVFMYI